MTIENSIISEVFNDDCIEGMKRTPDKFHDLAVCDVQYGIGVGKMAYLTEVKKTVTQKNGTKLSINKTIHTKKDWDSSPPPQEYFDEICRVSKHQIIFGIDYMNWTRVGTGRIKWDKMMSDDVSFNRYETAYCSLIDYTMEIQLLWAGFCQAKSISEPTTQQGNKRLNEKRIHPCHKPIMLYDIIYSKFAERGMKVIDTHLGGGSNRIAAHRAGLNFVGYEIDRDYFNAQEKRFAEFKSQLRMF